jgi:hypothetical protein
MSAKADSKTLRGLESTEGILRNVAILGGLWLAYKMVTRIQDSAGGAQRAIGQFLDEQAKASRARAKADRDTADTMREQNKKDTQRIREDLRRDQIERERKKRPAVPLRVNGRWEGNVFIPTERGGKP